MAWKAGDRFRYTDELGAVYPAMTISEFRETEIVAVDDTGAEFRIPPDDMFSGRAVLVK
jgi:hypothetical protein